MNLHRALVAALHAPGLLAQPERLARFALTDVERAQLLAVDPRAVATDPRRRERLVRTLAEELPASVALYTWTTRSYQGLLAFTSSDDFLDALAGDAPLVLAFATYLARAIELPIAADVATIERLKAHARRVAGRVPGTPGVVVTPGVFVAEVDGFALRTLQAIEHWLDEVSHLPQAFLCDDKPTLAIAGGDGSRAWLMTVPAAREITLADTDEGLARVLEYFGTPRPRASLAIPGVPAARAGALVDALIADGLLTET